MSSVTPPQPFQVAVPTGWARPAANSVKRSPLAGLPEKHALPAGNRSSGAAFSQPTSFRTFASELNV